MRTCSASNTWIASRPSRALEGLLLRHVLDALDFGKGADVTERRADGFGERALGQEGANLHALLHAAECVADVERDEAEQPEREQREGDRRDA